jgi:hypothetical protein
VGHFVVAVGSLTVAVDHFVVAAGMAVGTGEGDKGVVKGVCVIRD